MRLFPHSLIENAKKLYLDQITQVMVNWNLLEEICLSGFFPHNKFMETKTTITVIDGTKNQWFQDRANNDVITNCIQVTLETCRNS